MHTNSILKISNQQSEFAEPVEIIDEFGCSAWPNILPQIKYQGDLRAKISIQTFALDFDQVCWVQLHKIFIHSGRRLLQMQYSTFIKNKWTMPASTLPLRRRI